MTRGAAATAWDRAERVFSAAIRLPHSERPRFVAMATADDAELRQLVDRLLLKDDDDSRRLDGMPVDGTGGVDGSGPDSGPGSGLGSGLGPGRRVLGLPDAPRIGTTIGGWRLTHRIGAGGAGDVFRAEATAPADAPGEPKPAAPGTPAVAALKVLRPATNRSEVGRRFRAEVRSLERLDHPGIARLIDAGHDEDERRWLAMEYVDGQPIDRWCDEHRLGVAERLELVAAVCRAVQHAHRNLIVHRDIKPSNVLIRPDGTPVLVDFGIAKLLEPGEGSDFAPAEHTLTRHRMLTPDFASPEQILNGPITTASDIYSIGALLYVLLTGTSPLGLAAARPGELERLARDRRPQRPSRAVDLRRAVGTDGRSTDGSPAGGRAGHSESASPTADPFDASINRAWSRSVAACRGTTPERLRRELRGDPDTIVLTCLRKEPERRYASAEGLASDIDRSLRGLAIQARPDSRWRAVRRVLVRHRTLALTSSVLLASLVAATVISVRSARIAERALAAEALEAEHASIEAASTRSLSRFLSESVVAALAELEPGRIDLVQDLLEAESNAARNQFAASPHLLANILHGLGRSAVSVGSYEQAERLLTDARSIRVDHFGADDIEVALSESALGALDWRRGDYASAADHQRAALRIHRSARGDVHEDVAAAANDLGAILRRLGRADEAEPLLQEALRLRRGEAAGGTPGGAFGDDFRHPAGVAETLSNLGGLALDRRDFAAARDHAEESLAIRRRIYGPVHPEVGEALNNLAVALGYGGDLDAAAAAYGEAIACYRELGGAGLAGLARTLPNLAQVHMLLDRPADARAALEEAKSVAIARHGPSHVDVASILGRLAVLDADAGSLDAAIEQWQQAVAIQREAYGVKHAVPGRTLYSYGNALAAAERDEAALLVLEDAAATLDGTDAYWHGLAELAHVDVLRRLGRADEAAAHLDRARTILAAAAAADDPAFGALQRIADRLDADDG